MLAEVVDNGVTAEELERAKNRLIADAVYAQDSQRDDGALVRRGADDRLHRRAGSAPGPTASAPSRAEAVHDAARDWLDKRRSVTGYLIKERAAEEKRS